MTSRTSRFLHAVAVLICYPYACRFVEALQPQYNTIILSKPFGTIARADDKRHTLDRRRKRFHFSLTKSSVRLNCAEDNSPTVVQNRGIARVGRAVAIAVRLEWHPVRFEGGVRFLRVGAQITRIAETIAISIRLIRVVHHRTVVAVVADAVIVSGNFADVAFAVSVAVNLKRVVVADAVVTRVTHAVGVQIVTRGLNTTGNSAGNGRVE